jgi:acyl carrier protein
VTRTNFLRTLEEIFGVDRRTLQEDSSRVTVSEWTSLADAQIFSLIESEFGIEPNDELFSAQTIGDLLRILQSHGAFQE